MAVDFWGKNEKKANLIIKSGMTDLKRNTYLIIINIICDVGMEAILTRGGGALIQG